MPRAVKSPLFAPAFEASKVAKVAVQRADVARSKLVKALVKAAGEAFTQAITNPETVPAHNAKTGCYSSTLDLDLSEMLQDAHEINSDAYDRNLPGWGESKHCKDMSAAVRDAIVAALKGGEYFNVAVKFALYSDDLSESKLTVSVSYGD
jgi:hypothetical protein